MAQSHKAISHLSGCDVRGDVKVRWRYEQFGQYSIGLQRDMHLLAKMRMTMSKDGEM